MINGYRMFYAAGGRSTIFGTAKPDSLRGAYGIEWKHRDQRAKCNIGVVSDKIQKRDFKRARRHMLEGIDYTIGCQCSKCTGKKTVDCSCGIYIARSVRELIRQNYLNPRGNVHGQQVVVATSGWGVTVEYEKCWRVEFARMEHMWVIGGRIATFKKISERYAIPFTFVNSWSDLGGAR